VIIENLDVLFLDNGIEQALLNLATGRIVIVKDASFGVPSFLPQIQLFLPSLKNSFVEMDSNAHEFSNRGRSFGDDYPHCGLIAKTGACDQSVRNMQIKGVLCAGYAGDSSLCPRGVGIGRSALCDDRHGAMRRQFQRQTQACNTAPEDNKVKVIH
jgi:hypothetical protein